MDPIKQNIDKKFENLKLVVQKTFGGKLIQFVDYDKQKIPVHISYTGGFTILDGNYFMLRYFGITSHEDDKDLNADYIDNLKYEKYIEDKIREKASTSLKLPPIRLVDGFADSFYKDYIE